MQRYVLDCHCDFITSVSFSCDASLLATADNLPPIRLWRMSDGEEDGRLVLPDGEIPFDFFDWVSFLPDPGKLLALDTLGRLWLWKVDSQQCQQLATSMDAIVAAAVEPTGRTVVVGTDRGVISLWDVIDNRASCVLDRDIWQWDVIDNRALCVLDRDSEYLRLVNCLAFSPKGGSVAASIGNESRVRVYLTGEQPRQQCLVGHKDLVLSLDYSPDGRLLASASRDNTVRIWELARGMEIAALPGEGNIIRSVAFSPDGAWLAVGNGYGSFSTDDPASAVSIFRVADLSKVRRLVAHKDSIEALSFSRDGRLLASGGCDGRVIVWDLEGLGGEMGEMGVNS